MIKIALICDFACDFESVLTSCPDVDARFFNSKEAVQKDLTDFDGIILLPDRNKCGEYVKIFDRAVDSGSKIFSMVFPGMFGLKSFETQSTRFRRLVRLSSEGEIDGILPGDILEDQNNVHVSVSDFKFTLPLLAYAKNLQEHSHTDKYEELPLDSSSIALWLENPSLMLCSFDIGNFMKARFSPLGSWRALIEYIIKWLTGVKPLQVPLPYTTGRCDGTTSLRMSFDDAMGWFEKSEMLVESGEKGVYEGYATEISPDGLQKKAVIVRNDCCGETMLAFYMKHMLTGDDNALSVSDRISDFIFDNLFTDDKGSHLHGMMKWSLESPGICYQDDVARSVISQMLKCLYSGQNTHMEKVSDALAFLVSTTGTDGLRVTRTENDRLTREEVKRLANTPGGLTSAHYNAYYLGALLLNGIMTNNKLFHDTGVKGMETIMSVYPDTKRVLSETQEMCRLIFPLSMLYMATGFDRHKDMLYRVGNDLLRFKHPSGAFYEWDTGYKAKYSRTNGDESSLLSHNGDPVADLLYSVNWLPVGFIHAYFATDDEFFLDLWEQVSDFLNCAQLHSSNNEIDGAWARSWDLEKKEVFGIPNDVGWGPWCIESGWTVAEIASGLAMGLLRDRLKKLYPKSK